MFVVTISFSRVSGGAAGWAGLSQALEVLEPRAVFLPQLFAAWLDARVGGCFALFQRCVGLVR